MKTKAIEIWEVQNNTGKLLRRLVKNVKNPKEYIERKIEQYEESEIHLVATNFDDFRIEKYHALGK